MFAGKMGQAVRRGAAYSAHQALIYLAHDENLVAAGRRRVLPGAARRARTFLHFVR